MATRISAAIQHLRKVMLEQDRAGLSDGQLLDRFVEERDEAAAAALIRRHGPMVWGVCRRVLGNHHEVEDAFQATFLVFVRRAESIAPREMVGNWLYGVAYQTALKARAALAKRRVREKQVAYLPEIELGWPERQRELKDILDQELSRLPSIYRAAIVLCDLEGRTRIEAAGQLGVPPGTIAARLTRGRALLARRLTRHGLAISSGMLSATLSEQATASTPIAVVSSTIKAVTSFVAGSAASTSALSAQVVALTEGMVKAMFLSKVKLATGIALVLALTAAGGLLYQTHAGGPREDSPRVEHKRVDDARAAALKAMEQLGKSDAENDREAAIKALVDFRRELKAAEETRRRHQASAMQSLAERFQFRIPIELGVSEFKEGGRIDILEVWGTRPRIEVGGQYLVRGKYKLPPGQRGKLYFYLTATDPQGINNQLRFLAGGNQTSRGFDFSSMTAGVSDLDLQTTPVEKQEGEFTLVHGKLGEGYFHLVLANPERYSRMFANVYFGTGDNVLRKKTW